MSKLTWPSSIGPDFAYDASGVQATFSDGIKAIRKYGVYYNIAIWSKPVRSPPHSAQLQLTRLDPGVT